MRIAIKRLGNSNYIDTQILSRTQTIVNDKGVEETIPFFDEETLKQPPYNYSFVDIDDKFADCNGADFDYSNGQFTFNESKYNAKKELPSKQKRLAELENWFETYFEKQLIQSMWQTNFTISTDSLFKNKSGEFLTYESIEKLKEQGELVRAGIKQLRNDIDTIKRNG